MRCPVCLKEMEIQRKDISYNSKGGAEYNRIVYWCKEDDVWITTEIPTKTSGIKTKVSNLA